MSGEWRSVSGWKPVAPHTDRVRFREEAMSGTDETQVDVPEEGPAEEGAPPAEPPAQEPEPEE